MALHDGIIEDEAMVLKNIQYSGSARYGILGAAYSMRRDPATQKRYYIDIKGNTEQTLPHVCLKWPARCICLSLLSHSQKIDPECDVSFDNLGYIAPRIFCRTGPVMLKNTVVLIVSVLAPPFTRKGVSRLLLNPMDCLAVPTEADPALNHRIASGTAGRDDWDYRNRSILKSVDILAIEATQTAHLDAARSAWINLGTLIEESLQTWHIYPLVDGHPNAAGHRLVAQHLLNIK